MNDALKTAKNLASFFHKMYLDKQWEQQLEEIQVLLPEKQPEKESEKVP